MANLKYCPKCGSIKVEKSTKHKYRRVCLEVDCGHEGSESSFRAGVSSRQGNKKWRDPIALLPGGYDDNS